MKDRESEWVRRAQQGDHEAFCQLAARYERRIYGLAWHYCRNPQDAEDLSQEVWLKAFRAVGRFRGESNFYTWLRRITIHTFLKRKPPKAPSPEVSDRRPGREATDPYGESGATSTEPAYTIETHLHQRLLLERVMQALQELTPHERLIFLLKHREEMTCEEIAATCRCSAGTVKKTLFRAVGKLRRHLGIPVVSVD